jgi:histidine phosphotransferase ChpT
MSMKLDLLVSELLTSRLCHDLVGPVSAISNGLELIAEPDLGLDAEALDLVGGSVEQVSNALQFFRLAYGAAGGRGGTPEEVRRLGEAFLKHHKAALDWPPSVPPSLPDGAAKLLLNMIALAAESLPRGGRVGVVLQPGAKGFQISVVAQGSEADLRESVWRTLAEQVDVGELTPRTIHGFFTRRVAERLGGTFHVVREADDRLLIACLLPG